MDALDSAITRSDPVLRWYLVGIVLSQFFQVKIRSYILWLLCFPVILFGVFWIITGEEHRFALHSLDRTNPAVPHYSVAGLGFLGDTMVWPFFLLVPLLLVLLRGAIGKAVVLLRGSAALVRPDILDDPGARSDYNAIADRAATALCYRRWPWRWLRRLAVVLGLGLFAYNTVACVREMAWPNALIRYDRMPTWLKPYQSHKAVLIKPDTVVITLKDPASFVSPCTDAHQDVCLPPGLAEKLKINADRRRLTWNGSLSTDQKRELAALWPGTEWQQVVQTLYDQTNRGFVSDILLPVEKWDTDLRQAPLSWWAARLWALLLGYAVLPLALLRILNIILTTWQFVREMAIKDMLKANPYSSKSQESLKLIVETFWAANYCLIVVSIMVALSLFKIGIKPEWYDLALLMLVPLFAFAAVAPLLSISDIFERDVKQRYLSVHVAASDDMHRHFHKTVRNLNVESRRRWATALIRYDDYIARGQAASLFPISLKTITNLIAPVTPLLLALAEKLGSMLFG